jgi:quercetin dioxygenase-like cupin family protein
MASLTTNLAEKKDTNGAFCLVEATLARGNEPPPHEHSREDELFYVLEGEFDVYVGKEAFKVEKGECVFLPRLKPHGFAIPSPRIRLLTLFTPAGLEDAFRSASSPAKNLDLPANLFPRFQHHLRRVRPEANLATLWSVLHPLPVAG